MMHPARGHAPCSLSKVQPQLLVERPGKAGVERAGKLEVKLPGQDLGAVCHRAMSTALHAGAWACRRRAALRRIVQVRAQQQPQDEDPWRAPLWRAPPPPPPPPTPPPPMPQQPRQPAQKQAQPRSGLPGPGSGKGLWPWPPSAQPQDDQLGSRSSDSRDERGSGQESSIPNDNPRWRWPQVPGQGDSEPGQKNRSTTSPLSLKASQTARRLYKNEKLQELVRQEQERQQAGRWGKPPGETPIQTGVKGGKPTPGQEGYPEIWDSSSPPELGFFSSKEQAQPVLRWLEAQRAANAKRAERRSDTEVTSLALLYLAVAVAVIMAALLGTR